MNLFWIFLAILAPAIYGVSNMIDKVLIEKHIKDAIMLTILGGVISFVAGIILLMTGGFINTNTTQIMIVLLSGVLGEIALVPYYKAMSMDDASRIIPQFQIIPLIILLLSYLLLGETLSKMQILSFFLILLGGLMLSIQKLNREVFQIRKSFWWVLLSGLLFAGSFVLFKFVFIAQQNFVQTLGYEFIGCSIGALLLFFAYQKRFVLELQRVRRRVWQIIIFNEIIYTGGRIIGFYAATLAPLALISALGGTQSFFVLIYGLILSLWFPKIIKEDIKKSTLFIKFAAIILISIGIWSMNI